MRTTNATRNRMCMPPALPWASIAVKKSQNDFKQLVDEGFKTFQGFVNAPFNAGSI